ncbi:MAG: hypothetical protein ACI9BO_001478 [Zhongshania sp.]
MIARMPYRLLTLRNGQLVTVGGHDDGPE